MLMYEFDVKIYGVMMGLLSMCEVMGLHMYIALVDLDWDCEEGLMMFYVKWS